MNSCEMFRPKETYPKPYSWHHPAQLFMSLCILLDPSVVSTDHVMAPQMMREAAPCDPRHITAAVSYIYQWVETRRH